MRRFSFLVLSIPLLVIASMAQTPSPSVATSPSPSINQTAVLPSPSPTTESKGPPNLAYMVEMFASGVMLASVIGVLLVVIITRNLATYWIGPRHIQFVSVCLIVPTILILGLEKVLTSETTATLIGGLAGYLLSNLGKYEPPEPNTGPGGNGKANKPSQPAGPGEIAPEEPIETKPTDIRTQTQINQDKLKERLKDHPGGITLSRHDTAEES